MICFFAGRLECPVTIQRVFDFEEAKPAIAAGCC